MSNEEIIAIEPVVNAAIAMGNRGFEAAIDGAGFVEDAQVEAFLKVGRRFYGDEGINALYYRTKRIDANRQQDADDILKLLISGLEPSQWKTMPKTTLTSSEITIFEGVANYQTSGLWQKKVDRQALTDNEEKIVEKLGWRISGVDTTTWEAFFKNQGLTDEEQLAFDEQVREFYITYFVSKASDVIKPIAEVPAMKLTYIDKETFDKINAILKTETDDLWARAFYGQLEEIDSSNFDNFIAILFEDEKKDIEALEK